MKFHLPNLMFIDSRDRSGTHKEIPFGTIKGLTIRRSSKGVDRSLPVQVARSAPELPFLLKTYAH